MSKSVWWRRIRLILLSTFLISLVAYAGCDVWAGRQLAAELERVESQHGELKLVALKTPTVPAQENRGSLIRAAAVLVGQGTNEHRLATSAYLYKPALDPVPPSLVAYLESNAEAIELSRQFASRSRAGFGVDYGTPGDRPGLLEMRELGNVIYLAARRSMDAGRTDDAASLLVAGFALSSAFRNEPDLITQLVRVAVAVPPMDGLQRLLESTDPSGNALESLAKALAENRDPLPMTIGLLSEVALVHDSLSRTEAGQTVHPDISNLGWPFRGRTARLTRPYLRLTHARYLREVNELLALQTGPRPRPQYSDGGSAASSFAAGMTHTFTAGLRRAIESGDRFGADLAAAQSAVALRQFRLSHGVYPDALSALVPAFLPEVPLDPFTGRPPQYERVAEGFTLRVERRPETAKPTRPAAVWNVKR